MSLTIPSTAGRRASQARSDLAEIESLLLCAVVDGADLRGAGPASLDAAHDAAVYHLSSGGQRTRALLALATARALSLAPRHALHLAAACELLHNASLVHDDIHDRSPERRDRPAVWVLYGDAVAVCAGDLLLSCAFRTLARCDAPALLPRLLELAHCATSSAIRGQCGDLASKAGSQYSLEDYGRIAGAKSGALLALPVVLALASAGRDDSVPIANEAALHLAVAYQALDDLADVAEDSGPAGAAHVSARALNLMDVLLAMGYGSAAESLARAYARDNLASAEALAALLPQGSGQGIMEVCRQLGEAA